MVTTSKLLSEQHIAMASRLFFAPVIEKLAETLDIWDVFEKDHKAIIRELMPDMVNPEALVPFIAYYFQNLPPERLKEVDWPSIQLKPESEMESGGFSQSQKFSKEGRKGIKPVGTHFTTRAQYKTAHHYTEEQHP